MSTAEILAQVSNLSTEERDELLGKIWLWADATGPTDLEENALNDAQASYDANPDVGSTWADVQARLRKRQ